MIQTPHTKPFTYINCPVCGEDADELRVDHLNPGAKTRWFCDDCGEQISIHVLPNGDIETEPTGIKLHKVLVYLRSDKPFTFAVQGTIESDETAEEYHGHVRYLYEEQRCPFNTLQETLQIIDQNNDDDPHGIFTYLRTEPWRDLHNDAKAIDVQATPNVPLLDA